MANAADGECRRSVCSTASDVQELWTADIDAQSVDEGRMSFSDPDFSDWHCECIQTYKIIAPFTTQVDR